MFAKPAFLERSSAFTASRLDHRRLLVQLTDARDPAHVDDLGRFVPHLVAVQKIHVRLQPVLLNEFVDRQVFPSLAKADKNCGRCLNVANLRLQSQTVGEHLKRFPELDVDVLGDGKYARRVGRL